MVVSTQHHEKVSQKDIHDYVVSEVIRKTVPAELLTKEGKRLFAASSQGQTP